MSLAAHQHAQHPVHHAGTENVHKKVQNVIPPHIESAEFVIERVADQNEWTIHLTPWIA